MTRMKHKVVVASADSKNKEERKLKEQQCLKSRSKNSSKTYDRKTISSALPAQKNLKIRNLSKHVSTMQNEKNFDTLPKESRSELSEGKVEQAKNLDNDCQSCLIFPQKDGTFVLPNNINEPKTAASNVGPVPPQENKLTFGDKFCPEDELEQLIKDYNNSRKEYINKVSEKLTSYDNQPNIWGGNILPEINAMGSQIPEWEQSFPDPRNNSTNSVSPAGFSPNLAHRVKPNGAPVRKVMSGAPIRPVNSYASNIANIVNKSRPINSAYYQSREGVNLAKQAGVDSSTMMGFKAGGLNRFPREIFSLGVRGKKSLA